MVTLYISILFSCLSCLFANEKIPVIFSSHAYSPQIYLNIQRKDLLLLVDLGSCVPLALIEPILENLEKTDLYKTRSISDCKGNNYDLPLYQLSDVLGGSIEAVQESLEFCENTKLWGTPKKSEYIGQIGWNFFQKHNAVLFDFPNSVIHTLDQPQALKGFVSIPFTIDKGVITIDIETDWGIQKMVVDTGSSYSIIKRQDKLPTTKVQCKKTNKMLIGNIDFGSLSFLVSDLVHFDGILGVDFFLEHKIMIDFKNQVMLIENPKSNLALQWQRFKFYVIQTFTKLVHKRKEVLWSAL